MGQVLFPRSHTLAELILLLAKRVDEYGVLNCPSLLCLGSIRRVTIERKHLDVDRERPIVQDQSDVRKKPMILCYRLPRSPSIYYLLISHFGCDYPMISTFTTGLPHSFAFK